MKLSAPLYSLKRKARLLSRGMNIPLHKALDTIAAQEGFSGWSLLITKISETLSADDLFMQLKPGDLVLLGARPGQGKTLLSLELLTRAMKAGRKGVLFTLEYTEQDVRERFLKIGTNWQDYKQLFVFDSSDAISSDYIINKLAAASRNTIVIIDYLQILDQMREKPNLMDQVAALKIFAQDKGLILVFISQIDRSYDQVNKPCPDIGDVRMPNPLNLSLFNNTKSL